MHKKWYIMRQCQKKLFSTTLVQKIFFGHDFSRRNIFLKVFQRFSKIDFIYCITNLKNKKYFIKYI